MNDNKILSRLQAGFVKKKKKQQYVTFLLLKAISGSYLETKWAVCAWRFVDLEQAFGSMNREAL
jgi:hypothetical protein